MSAKLGRPVDPQKDRDILEAARELAFAGGPKALTMDKVASRAGLSKATLYARYANRYELLRAVVHSEALVINQPLERLPESREQLCADLASLCLAINRFIGSERHQHLLQAMCSIPQDRQDLSEVYRNGPAETQRVLAEYLQAAAQNGLIRCPQPLASAEMLIGMVIGLDVQRVLYGVGLERKSEEDFRQHAQRVAAAFMVMHG